MKFKMIRSKKTKNIDVLKYLINWDHKVSRGGKMNFGQFQFNVKQLLRPYWEKDLVCEEFPVPAIKGEGGKSIDLINLTRGQVIEVDGQSHFEYNSFFHKDKDDFLNQMKRDCYKEYWAELNAFKFYRIYETDELNKSLLQELGII